MNLNEAKQILEENDYVCEAKLSKANQAKYDAAIAALEELGYDTKYITKKKKITPAQQKQNAKDKADAIKKWGKYVNTGKHWNSKYPKANSYETVEDESDKWNKLSDKQKIEMALPHIKKDGGNKTNPMTDNCWSDDVLDIDWVHDLFYSVKDKLWEIGSKNDMWSSEFDDYFSRDIDNGLLYDIITIKNKNKIVSLWRSNYDNP